MTYLINDNGPGPMLRGILAVALVATAMVGAIAEPVEAAEPGAREEIRIAATNAQLRDGRSLTQIRRRIAIGAGALCDRGGVASLYRNGARRCRDRVAADAERQIEARIAGRLAGGGRGQPGAPLSMSAILGVLGLSFFMANATR